MVHLFGFFCSCHVAIRCAKAVWYWAPRIFHQFLNVHLTLCLRLDQKLYCHTAVLFVCDNFVFCCLGFNSLGTRLECFQIWLLDWIKETFLCVKPLLDKLFFSLFPNRLCCHHVFCNCSRSWCSGRYAMQLSFIWHIKGIEEVLYCRHGFLNMLLTLPYFTMSQVLVLADILLMTDCMSALEYVTSTYWAFWCAVFTHLW